MVRVGGGDIVDSFTTQGDGIYNVTWVCWSSGQSDMSSFMSDDRMPASTIWETSPQYG